MAATGYTPISLYYSTTAAATPLAANLTNGELAINITDGKLFYKDNAGVVQTLVSKNATVTSFSAGTTGLTPSTATSGAVTLAGTLNVANGGTGSTTAAGARTNLGATTLGGNMFTLANPSAITFPRFNADNTVSALDAASFRTAIGAGTGGGSVTSVSGTGTVNGITLTGTVTSTGSLTLGGTLSGVSLTTQVTGTLPVANGGTGATTLTANNVILGNGTSAVQVVAPGASGNVLTSNGTTWVSQAAGGDPIGAFKEFAGDTTTTYPGSSWLRCAGGIVSQSTYSTLYGKVGLLTDNVTIGGIHNYVATQTGRSVVYGNSLFIAATDGGCYSSTDGGNWTIVSNGPVTDVSYGTTSRWVGSSATVFRTSTNGTTWTTPYTHSTNINKTAYNNSAATDKYFFVDNSPYGYSSTDGVTWTFRVNVSSTPTVLQVNNGLTILANAASSLWTSTDNITFTSRTPNVTSGINSMAYASTLTQKYVIVGNTGQLASSTDGITWTARTSNTSSNISSVAFDGTKYYYFGTGGSGFYSTSTDGITWASPTTNYSFYETQNSVTSNGAGTMVMAVTGGSVYNAGLRVFSDPLAASAGSFSYANAAVYDSTNDILLSFGAPNTNLYAMTSTNNGITWTARTGATTTQTTPFTSVAYNSTLTQKYLIAGGSNATPVVSTSTDLVTWTSRTVAAGIGSIVTATAGASLYVVGGYGAIGSTSYVQTSTDGITWTARNVAFPSSGANSTYYVNGAVYASDQTNKYLVYGYVSSGSPTFTTTYYINTSTDGITWGTPTSYGTSPSIDHIIYANGLYVGVFAGAIKVSADAVLWSATTVTTGASKVVYGNGLFMYGGDTGKIGYSYDARTWTTTTVGSTTYGAGYSSKNKIGIFNGQNYTVGNINKFSYNIASDFALPAQNTNLARSNVDKLYIKAL